MGQGESGFHRSRVLVVCHQHTLPANSGRRKQCFDFLTHKNCALKIRRTQPRDFSQNLTNPKRAVGRSMAQAE